MTLTRSANCRTGCSGRVDLRYTVQVASAYRRLALESWAAVRADTPGSESAKSSRASESHRPAASLARRLAVSGHPNQTAMYANSAGPSRQWEVAYPHRNPNMVLPNRELS